MTGQEISCAVRAVCDTARPDDLITIWWGGNNCLAVKGSEFMDPSHKSVNFDYIRELLICNVVGYNDVELTYVIGYSSITGIEIKRAWPTSQTGRGARLWDTRGGAISDFQ